MSRSVTPHSDIGRWVTEAIENGMSLDEVVEEGTRWAMSRTDVLEGLAEQIVRREAVKLFAGPREARHPKPISREELEPRNLPAPVVRDRIFLDVANMTAPEVLNLASEVEQETVKSARTAGFLRGLASQLAKGEKVKDRFDLDALKRLHDRTTVTLKLDTHLGSRPPSTKLLTS